MRARGSGWASLSRVRRLRGVGATVVVSGALAAPVAGLQGQERIVEMPAADRRLSVAVEEVYRLGGADAEDWRAFQRVREVAFDGRGLLYVLDQGASVVRVVRPDGSLLRTLGREGDGPGEFSAPVGMAVASDGTVLVADLGRRSLAIFAPDGAYLRNARPDGSRGRLSSFTVDGRHRVVGFPSVVYGGRPGSPTLVHMIQTDAGPVEDPPGLPLLRADLEGGEAELLRWAWMPEREAEGGSPVETAFLPRVHWGLLPDGRVAVVDSLDYRIRLVGDGDEVVIRRPLPVPATSGAHRRAEIERRAAEGAEGGVGGGTAAAGMGRGREEAFEAMMRERRSRLEETLAFYPELQVVQGLEVDRAGRLWIQRIGESPGEPGPVDVVASDGRYLGTVAPGALTLPDGFGPDGLAVWVERDELDVPVVVVRRVTPGTGS